MCQLRCRCSLVAFLPIQESRELTCIVALCLSVTEFPLACCQSPFAVGKPHHNRQMIRPVSKSISSILGLCLSVAGLRGQASFDLDKPQCFNSTYC